MKKIFLVLIVMILMISNVHAENREVTIFIPEYDIVLNGVKVNNVVSDYPFISYNGITYIPMTYDLTASLGLSTSWSAEEGLVINKIDQAIAHTPTGNSRNTLGRKYSAEIVTTKVTVNGQVIDNSQEAYPLLSFKNITYFPMTYDFMVNDFNASCTYSLNKGLNVSVDPSVEFVLPKPIEESLTLYSDEFKEKLVMTHEICSLRLVSDDTVIIDFDFNTQKYAGKYLTIYADYYDHYGRAIYTESLIQGLKMTELNKLYTFSPSFTLYDSFGKVKLRFVYEDQLLVADKVEKIEESVELHHDVRTVEATMLKDLDVAYVRTITANRHHSIEPYSLLSYKYNALLSEFVATRGNDNLVVTYSRWADGGTFPYLGKDDDQHHYIHVPKSATLKFEKKNYFSKVMMYIDGQLVKEAYGNTMFFYDSKRELVAIYTWNDDE